MIFLQIGGIVLLVLAGLGLTYHMCKLAFAKYQWMRFTFYLPRVKLTGPWQRFDQNEIDQVYTLFEVDDAQVNYLHFVDKKGKTYLIPKFVLQNSIAKIESKNRFF